MISNAFTCFNFCLGRLAGILSEPFIDFERTHVCLCFSRVVGLVCVLCLLRRVNGGLLAQ